MGKYVVVLVVSEEIDPTQCKKRLLRRFNILLRRISRPNYHIFPGYDYATRCGLVPLVLAGMPQYKSNPTTWTGGTIVCFVPLAGLKLDRFFVERLYPILRDPVYADRLGAAMLNANLGQLAQWLANQPAEHRRTGVQAGSHLHFGLAVGAEPNLVFFFSASAITEALGVTPRSSIELLLDLAGRVARSDVPVKIGYTGTKPWNGLLIATVETADLGLDALDESVEKLLQSSPALVDWLGEKFLFAHLGKFQTVVATLPSVQFDKCPDADRFYHYGLRTDDQRKILTWYLHIGAIRAGIGYELLVAATEGENL